MPPSTGGSPISPCHPPATAARLIPSSLPTTGAADTAPIDSGLDAGFDAPPDVLTLPDVGPPGNPGVALTAGGTYATSASYIVFGALGESPGGNTTLQSANYKLQSGVIGATQ